MAAHFATMSSLSAVIAAAAVMTWTLVSDVEAGRRAMLLFGDTGADTGNNNYLATKYRADFPPYGVDFPGGRHPTGRFSNGLIPPDFISYQIGLGYILPYLSPDLKGELLLRGASFASAGIGILNATGVQRGYLIRMYQQFLYYEEYRRRVVALIGEEETDYFIQSALCYIALGDDDILSYYYDYYLNDDDHLDLSSPDSRRQFDGRSTKFVGLIVFEFKKYLMRLYELGFRRILVKGSGPVGCYPKVLAAGKRSKKKKRRSTSNGKVDDECDEELQSVAASFNSRLGQVTTQLNSDVGYQAFIFINAFDSGTDIIANPRSYGLTTSNVACCGQGSYNGEGRCTVASNLCSDRDAYVFWDSTRPTQRTSQLLVDQILYGSSGFVSPMNLSSIMAVDHWS